MPKEAKTWGYIEHDDDHPVAVFTTDHGAYRTIVTIDERVSVQNTPPKGKATELLNMSFPYLVEPSYALPLIDLKQPHYIVDFIGTKTETPMRLVVVDNGEYLTRIGAEAQELTVKNITPDMQDVYKKLSMLSGTEARVFLSLIKRKNRKSIGESLEITERSVTEITRRIKDKLHTKSTVDMLKIALQAELVTLEALSS